MSGTKTVETISQRIDVSDDWVHPVLKRHVVVVEVMDLEDGVSRVLVFPDSGTLDTGHIGLLAVAASQVLADSEEEDE